MFKPRAAFSGFSVDSLEKAREFYTGILGLKVDQDAMGLTLHLPGGARCSSIQRATTSRPRLPF